LRSAGLGKLDHSLGDHLVGEIGMVAKAESDPPLTSLPPPQRRRTLQGSSIQRAMNDYLKALCERPVD
jgi:hypothetical protein